MTPRAAIIVPAYNEGERIVPFLDRLFDAVSLACEVLVVVDDESDTTLPFLQTYAEKEPRLRPTVNTFGRGPANAIRFGIERADARVLVVTMADGSDDPEVIGDLVKLVERGVVVAAASRYAPGGQQVGGPRLKRRLSRLAGRLLHTFAGIATRDATNSFKAYDRDFVRAVGVHSRDGFEIGLELVAKARRLRLPIAELPTIWLDRSAGESNFKLVRWLPRYLFWFRFAFGPRLSVEQIRARLDAA